MESRAYLFSNCPEFFLTDIECEPAGQDCVRVFHYRLVDNVRIPLFTAVLTAENLVKASRMVSDAALDVFNMEQMRGALITH